MPNSVRQQTPTGRRDNPAFVPPAPSAVDPDGVGPRSNYRPQYSDEEVKESQFARQRQLEANSSSFAPLIWIIALVIVAGAAYYLFTSPAPNVPTATVVPSGQAV